MYKIAFFDTKPYDRHGFEKYAKEYGIEFDFLDTKLSSRTAFLAKDADGVCAFVNDDLGQEVIDALYAYGIRLVVLRCAGFNNVDTLYAKNKLTVLRVPEYSPYAVAEHAMAMLLTSIRRIHKAYNRTRDFNFSLNGFTGFELHGKTVGIIGTGKIGRVFGDICKGFKMRVIAYDIVQSDDFEYTDLNTLFKESDIISLHCPLTKSTDGLIDKKAISVMKKGVVIINTSRGGLIDSNALIDGIKDRKVGAACLDVYEEESDIFFEDFSGHIVDDDTLAVLLSFPNVLITSHQAFLTTDALDNIACVTCKNIVNYFNNSVEKSNAL